MAPDGTHPEEGRRLSALYGLGLLDTAAEERFDRITRLAAAVLDVPIALVSLVDAERLWFKSRIGVSASEMARDQTFCAQVIADPSTAGLVVNDAFDDERFADNPLVTGDHGVRFYAGRVVHSPDGMPVGTLCVIDHKPRQLSPAQQQSLVDLGRMVEEELAREHNDAILSRLAESEQLKSSIIETMAEGLVLQGEGGEILDSNGSAQQLLGRSADELAALSSGDNRWRAVREDGTPCPGEDHPAMVCLATGVAVRNQIMGVHRRDGTTVWLRVSSEPTVDPLGRPRALTVFADVTEERHLAAAMQAETEIARLSLDALDQGVVLVDRSGEIRRSNPAVQRILGYSDAELTARFRSGNWLTFDETGANLPEERRPMYNAFAGRATTGQMIQWRHRSGRMILLRVSCVPHINRAGNVLVTFTDVTEEQQMLQDLARFQHLFEHANDMITVLDADAQVLYASPSTQRVLGYPDEWEHPDGVLSLVHPEDLPLAAAELQLLVDGSRGPEPFMVRVRAFAGDWRHIECIGVNLLDEPNVRGVVLTSRDATDRVQLTAQLVHLAAHDPLTDLPNRSLVRPRLAELLAESGDDHRVGLCFIDLDRFKEINDAYGHAVGDKVLVAVADRIRSVIGPLDTAARIGGDEFVIILGQVANRDQAVAAAQGLGRAIMDEPLVGPSMRVGVSVGVAVSEHGESPESLLSRADAALYRAKAKPGLSAVLADRSQRHHLTDVLTRR